MIFINWITVIHEISLKFQLNLSAEQKKWTLVTCSGTTPSARYGHTMTLVGDEMYLFGGIDANKQPLNDLHIFNFSNFSLKYRI